MKNQIALFVSRINRQHIQLFLTVLALAMLVLGAGAPTGGSDGPH